MISTLPRGADVLATLIGRAVHAPARMESLTKLFAARFPQLRLSVKKLHQFSSTQINIAEVGYSRSQGPLEPVLRAMQGRIDHADLDDAAKELSKAEAELLLLLREPCEGRIC